MFKSKTGRFKLILIILAVAVVLLTGGIIVYLNGIGAVDPGNEETVTVEIPSGSGASAIVDILDENGLIKSPAFAKIHARIGGYDTLQANSYMFSKSMTLPEMMDAINTGDFDYISKDRIIIREGLTIPEVAAAIAEEMPFTAEEIIAKWADTAYLEQLIDQYWFLSDAILADGVLYPLEGYLYPETYFVTEEDPTIESITEIMLDMTATELDSRREAIDESGFSVHQLLTLASIVEREGSNVKDEMPAIAGVFINRLNEGMNLGSDVTVGYALQKTSLQFTQSELDVDSPYNTRKNAGLPIGPICCVNGEAIDSVLNYEESDYLYFFATKDGDIIYSRTNEEHEKAVSENIWY